MSQTEPPPRLDARHFDPELWCLFDQYVHGQIDRRGFLDRAGRFAAAAGTTATGLLAFLAPDFARAQKVAPGDPRVKAESVLIDSPAGYGKARLYVVRPAAATGPLPVVLVVHENRGLNPHIEDVARRIALADFIAVAPDALHPLGGYPGDEDKAREAFARLDQAKTRQDFIAAAQWAEAAPGGNGRLGATGFCYGGGMVNFLATRLPTLRAGAPFYGAPAPAGEELKIRAELEIAYAENDERINAAWPDYENGLKAAGVRYAMHRYPGTQHGFNNDTTPRYQPQAAEAAWGRMLALFNRTLRG